MLLTVLFLWPLARSNIVNPVVKRVAIRTLLASTVALVTSAAHMLILTLLHGHELGWVCLGSCGADVGTLRILQSTHAHAHAHRRSSSMRSRSSGSPAARGRALPARR